MWAPLPPYFSMCLYPLLSFYFQGLECFERQATLQQQANILQVRAGAEQKAGVTLLRAAVEQMPPDGIRDAVMAGLVSAFPSPFGVSPGSQSGVVSLSYLGGLWLTLMRISFPIFVGHEAA